MIFSYSIDFRGTIHAKAWTSRALNPKLEIKKKMELWRCLSFLQKVDGKSQSNAKTLDVWVVLQILGPVGYRSYYGT